MAFFGLTVVGGEKQAKKRHSIAGMQVCANIKAFTFCFMSLSHVS
jgi:hypothetical protein